jgi:hypothetical protein
MCHLLIRVESRGADKIGAWLAGDVVDVLADGHVFSESELSGVFRVLTIPGMPAPALGEFLDAQVSVGGTQITRRAKGFRMDSPLGALLLASAGAPFVASRGAAWEAFNSVETRTKVEAI